MDDVADGVSYDDYEAGDAMVLGDHDEEDAEDVDHDEEEVDDVDHDGQDEVDVEDAHDYGGIHVV